jgi:hypothetical protein
VRENFPAGVIARDIAKPLRAARHHPMWEYRDKFFRPGLPLSVKIVYRNGFAPDSCFVFVYRAGHEV